MQESDFYSTYRFQLSIDNELIINAENHRPELYEDVQVYFSDKYYPPADAYVKNFYACQGDKTFFSVGNMTLELKCLYILFCCKQNPSASLNDVY